MAAARQLLVRRLSSSYSSLAQQKNTPFSGIGWWNKGEKLPSFKARVAIKPPFATPGKDGIVLADGDDGDGISLGTVKLPGNLDIARFESLLYQWGNSLSQGANIPLPVPLKVDRVEGGVRLGFVEVEDGKTEVLVYIDCLVFPASATSGPVFRAIRNGPLKDKDPPGEPRIMTSLLQALQKSVEIAQV